MIFKELFTKSEIILQSPQNTVEHKLQKICELLKEQVSHYDWVGFYFKNGDKNELKLRAFSGESTAHAIIPFGNGICGQVAESNSTLNVPDVAAIDNYIACGINVKSELVVPLFKNGENIGQIDIDSHKKESFTHDDEAFLTRLNQEIEKILI